MADTFLNIISINGSLGFKSGDDLRKIGTDISPEVLPLAGSQLPRVHLGRFAINDYYSGVRPPVENLNFEVAVSFIEAFKNRLKIISLAEAALTGLRIEGSNKTSTHLHLRVVGDVNEVLKAKLHVIEELLRNNSFTSKVLLGHRDIGSIIMSFRYASKEAGISDDEASLIEEKVQQALVNIGQVKLLGQPILMVGPLRKIVDTPIPEERNNPQSSSPPAA